jgi:hypothetical protein
MEAWKKRGERAMKREKEQVQMMGVKGAAVEEREGVRR